MKYLLLVFSVLLLSSCNRIIYSTQIGVNIQNIHQIVADTNQLKFEWNKMITENNIKGEVSNFNIKTGIDERTEKKYYYLIAKNKEGDLKMATRLIKHNNIFFLNTSELIYVICYGCTTSYPEIYNGYWGCDSKDLFKCKKIEIVKF